MKEYKKENIKLAKALRKNMTPWERKLWYEFLREYPIRFQRQKSIGSYIVDFYCAKAKLVIELDGGGHYNDTQCKADELRTKELEKLGLRVVRICNLDVDNSLFGVSEFIRREVEKSLPSSDEEGGFCESKTRKER
ncbi:MAG: endonuclease domain-containing protein [Clostridia bacterium]|nr:endonuclease domain-containing protein [Clostridia bacterium]